MGITSWLSLGGKSGVQWSRAGEHGRKEEMCRREIRHLRSEKGRSAVPGVRKKKDLKSIPF